MDSTPKTCIDQFTHPHHHPLTTTADYNQRFFCNGCRTTGIGQRFWCNACNLDLHGFCATCPRSLSSFMHPHPLTLLVPNPASSVHLVCDLCRETIHGLFYRCADCNFNVHPICTKLPERINHILDRIHLLILQSPPADGAGSTCAVCLHLCAGWRYACRACRVDIHLECVLGPAAGHQQHVHSRTGQQEIPMFNQKMGNIPIGQQGIPIFNQNMGIPFHAPPWRVAPFYGIPFHAQPQTFGGYGPRFNMYHGPYAYPLWPHNSQVGANNSHNWSRFGKTMFDLVTKLGMGVMSNMIFGVDIYGDARVRCIESEREALLSFKNGLIYNQGMLLSWRNNECCKWHGVECNNTTGHAITLQLYGMNYDGELQGEVHSFG
ncbi:uncharacterized protein LOC125195519 [Salvia hispanica]|uniref:uncharacterized protein LOC125195519 n=1 Tax=Salvia hispanica TaxID=49212 RepID=UPI0020098A8E|nr:uncharacterized protein LOC125195519 [Salvia hispanica]